MTDSWDGAAPTRNEDAVETDAQAASGAEELDEDRLRVDPLCDCATKARISSAVAVGGDPVADPDPAEAVADIGVGAEVAV